MATVNDRRAQLIDELADVIREFNFRKAAILQKAFEEGGDAQVDEVIDKLQELRDARFELIQRSLDTSTAGFVQLTAQAVDAKKELEKAIQDLQTVAQVIGTAAKVIDLIGRIIIRFGI